MMEVIILNLLLLKFSTSFIAASQSRSFEPSFKNQKIFAKVLGQGECHILPRKVTVDFTLSCQIIPELVAKFQRFPV